MTLPTAAIHVVCHLSLLKCLVTLTGLAIALAPPTAARAETCVTKHGSATGITRGFAEYEAFLIIRQVTGN